MQRSWSQADRQDNQRRSGDSQENAKEQPRARVAPHMQDLGDKQTQGEQSATARWRSLLRKPSGWERMDWTQRYLRYLKFDLSRLQPPISTHACKGNAAREEW